MTQPDIAGIFERFAADFETAAESDDWSRLGQYLAEDASYLNVSGPEPVCRGRDNIVAYLQADFAGHDRHFDSRTLGAVTSPVTDGNRLIREWRCTYTLAGAPDLVVEGEARYLFEDGLIKSIEEELTAESMQRLNDWMRNHGDRLNT